MTILHLIRHGESEWHERNRYAGHTDIHLTENGHMQANSLIAWAAEAKPRVIYSSDLARAIETAKPMTNFLGLDLRIDSRLREVNFGDIEGLTPDEMLLQYSSLRRRFLEYPANTTMPNGESGVDALNRAIPVLIEITAEIDNASAIIVCHGTLMRILACWMLGIDTNQYRRVFPAIPNSGRISLQLNSETLNSDLANCAGLLEFR